MPKTNSKEKVGCKTTPKADVLPPEEQEAAFQWSTVNTDWEKIERVVFKLQKRIYKASKRGEVKTVRRLQKTLIRSHSARMLAVRRVTQENKGKKTAGVDGVKNVLPTKRFELVKTLRLSGKCKATRRVWIPKPNTDEKRPLGIPTMYDRALQALVKSALEPEWEAKFEPNSYGFRIGRGCHDAIEAIYNSISQKIGGKYVLDADISKCFDKIDHNKLLKKLNTYPKLSRQIKAWLKSGVIDNGVFEETQYGTPQGGVISPLLANIALHGMENLIKEYAAKQKWRYENGKTKGKAMSKEDKQSSISLIRYADDFVILHHSLEVIKEVKTLMENWLKEIGLELSLKKTRITHTLKEHEGNVGFDFLGFNVRQYPVGEHQCGKNSSGEKLEMKTLIKPSKEKIKEHSHKMLEVIRKHKSSKQEVLISELNPIIRGWTNYNRAVVCTETFSHMSHLTYLKLKRWGERRHPKKSKSWVANKYWHTIKKDNWVFSIKKDGIITYKLLKHSETKQKKHIKVEGKASPYDGNWVYWGQRLENCPNLSTRVQTLLKRQEGKCAYCKTQFKVDSKLEIDHILSKCKGGKDEYENLQLLHLHCHDKKTAKDGSNTNKKQSRRTHDKGQLIEEPCEVKVSRTVLKTSHSGDIVA